MTLKPIAGAPHDATIPNFPTNEAKPVKAEPIRPALPPMLLTKRSEPNRHVRMSQKRGYGEHALLIGLHTDGALTLYPTAKRGAPPTIELGPVEARQFISVWRRGTGEYSSQVGAFKISAKWLLFDDGKRGFSVIAVYELAQASDDPAIMFSASEAGAAKALKEAKEAGWGF